MIPAGAVRPCRRRTVALLLAALAGCVVRAPVRLAWVPVETANAALPEQVRVYAATDPSVPLRAWYVRVRPRPPVRVRVIAAGGPTGLETAEQIARRTGARVLVNAGYYRLDRGRPEHIGLLLVGGRLLQPPLRSVIQQGRRRPVVRAALGFHADGHPEIGWAGSREGQLVVWPGPVAGGQGGDGDEAADARRWPVVDAVAGGPMLVVDGAVRVTAAQEAFADSASPRLHPRTAAGITAEGDLILMVVDGRQRDSRGVTLEQLAGLLQRLGCVRALNLDGGGSSAVVVDGRLLNRPWGGEASREIVSALAVFTPRAGS